MRWFFRWTETSAFCKTVIKTIFSHHKSDYQADVTTGKNNKEQVEGGWWRSMILNDDSLNKFIYPGVILAFVI